MKKLLIGLLTIGSLSAFADQVTPACNKNYSSSTIIFASDNTQSDYRDTLKSIRWALENRANLRVIPIVNPGVLSAKEWREYNRDLLVPYFVIFDDKGCVLKTLEGIPSDETLGVKYTDVPAAHIFY